MEFGFSYYLKSFVSLFAICDPVGTVPLFITLTAAMSAAQRKRTLEVMVAVAASVLVGAVWAGMPMLKFFGISLPAFRAAGGVLLLIVAIDMLQARSTRTKRTPEEAEEAFDRDGIAIMPLAVPMLAGPGAISTTIVYTNQSHAFLHRALLTAIIVLIAVISYLVFRLSGRLSRALGQSGINLVSRLMGLVLAAVGMEFVFQGVAGYFPSLAGGS